MSPFEKHPYLEVLSSENTAPVLMIGIFPTITYLCDLIKKDSLTFQGKSTKGLKRSLISYFHGNEGTLGDHSPFDYYAIIDPNPDREDRKHNLINVLKSYKVVYTDIIQFCQ